MENLFVTVTNLYGLRAINLAFKQNQFLEASVLSCACIASIVYHLSETKHGMNSLCLKNKTNITLNIDRFFALMSVAVFGLKYYNMIQNNDQQIIKYGVIGLTTLILSESQHIISLPRRIEKSLYLITHPIWHITAFHVAYLLLTKKN